MNKITISTKLLLLLTLLFFIPVFYIYYKEAVSFHFIDEYNNILAGYFLLKGKILYSQIFFQHQPIMAYISYFIQKVLHPTTLYKLITYHRLAIIFTALLFDLLLVYRFRFVGLGFSVIFELTKYYLFGNTFLAESMVIYPLVYLLGLAWEVLQNRPLARWEILLSGFLTFFVVFMREPYIPTALLLFAILLVGKSQNRIKVIAICLFFFLSAVVLFSLPIKDYLFELTNVNITGVISGEIQSTHLIGPGIIIIFLYPLLILIDGLVNYFRGALVIIDLLFLLAIYQYSSITKNYKKALVLLFILGISNIRITTPGTIYYAAYHMLVWYGLFVFSTMLLVKKIYTENSNRLYKIITSILLLMLCIYLILPQNELLWSKIDKQTVFNNNYGQYYSSGELVHDLANSRTTVFVDGWDSLVYWQADQPVAYPYIFYYPPMSTFPLYTNARTEMFKNTPPEFVYSSCKLYKNKLLTYTFKEYSAGTYAVFYHSTVPNCLFIRKSALKQITTAQWNSIKSFAVYLKS